MNINFVRQAADYVLERLQDTPTIGLILGSGLGGIATHIEQAVKIPYADIPHFAVSTAPGHAGCFVAGRLGGKSVICMQGRLHFYEGHSMQDIIFPIRVMKLLGVKTLIATNAAGGINHDFSVGDLMLIQDHINFLGTNPLIGKNDEAFGPRFCDMTYTYTPALREAAQKQAHRMGIDLKTGVYLACSGPSFETPAEIRAFRTWGADAVGMSTVPEVIAAAHCGMQVLAISLITNMAAGMQEQSLNGQEVIELGKARGKLLEQLIENVILYSPSV